MAKKCKLNEKNQNLTCLIIVKYSKNSSISKFSSSQPYSLSMCSVLMESLTCCQYYLKDGTWLKGRLEFRLRTHDKSYSHIPFLNCLN
jgi:hypothetical protein